MTTAVGVGSSSWASQGAGAGGSVAERAYRRAVAEMTRAMQTLAKHAAEGADEDVLKGDQQAVDLAAAAMSQAVAAMAREEQQAVEARQAVEQREAEVARRDASEEAGPADADGGVDTYA